MNSLDQHYETLPQYIHLYDARNYSGGAFAEMKVSQEAMEKMLPKDQSLLSQSHWTSLTFNADGNQILASGKNGLTLLVDGYDGTVQKNLSTPGATYACFTPDDKTVLCGNHDGSIRCWNVSTGTLLKKLEGHTGPVNWVGANPKHAMLASCCSNTALWLW